MSIGIPLIGILLFYALRFYSQLTPASSTPAVDVSKNSNLRPVGIVDQAGLLDPAAHPFGLIFFDSVDAAQAAISASQIASYYVIPASFKDNSDTPISMYFDRFSLNNINSDALKPLIVKGLLRGKTVDPDVAKRLQSDLTFDPHVVSNGSTKQTNSGDTSFWLAYVFSIALLMSAFITSGYLMQSIVEEKETRMIEILLSSMRPTQLLAGKILALGSLGLIQIALWGAALIYVLQQLPSTIPQMGNIQPPATGQIVILIVYFILGYLMLSAFYASIGAIATNMREGPQLAALIAIPVGIPFYFLSLIAASPEGPLAVGLSIFPLTAPITMVSRAAVSDVPLIQIVISVILLLLTITFAIWVAGRLFRVNTLLAGQLPKLRDLPRLIRESV
jgi:ABC-2 type transport system permease protein